MLGLEPRIVAEFAAIDTYEKGWQQVEGDVIVFWYRAKKNWYPVLRMEPLWDAISIQVTVFILIEMKKNHFYLGSRKEYTGGVNFYLNIVNKAIDKGQNLARW